MLSGPFLISLHRLEAEIEAARLKAKEEMMQGIQVAKEMAQKELSEQKSQYEERIKALERELVSCSHTCQCLACATPVFSS